MPRKKSPVTPPGIDPGTFRLVVQCLNHYATAGPVIIIIIIIIIIMYRKQYKTHQWGFCEANLMQTASVLD
jgi:hypothetical protein